MPAKARGILQAARVRICSSRKTIDLARDCITRNDRVVEHMTLRAQARLHDGALARRIGPAMSFEHSTAQIWIARQLISIARELVRTSRRRLLR